MSPFQLSTISAWTMVRNSLKFLIVIAVTDKQTEPAHAQMAENRTAYIILKLLKDGAIKDNSALLSFSYDLVELASEQGKT